jgi:hypothetical protein
MKTCPAAGSGPGQHALDRLIGRAIVDPAFRGRLLADAGHALALEHMPLVLKRALVAIRARDQADFGARALDALRSPHTAPRPAGRAGAGRPPA